MGTEAHNEESGWFKEFQKLNKPADRKPPPPPPPPTLNPPEGRSMSASSGKDSQRREYLRFEVDEATATVYREGLLTKVGLSKNNLARFAFNLSEGGVAVQLIERLVPGTKVQVRVTMEKYDDTIEASGEVRWCHQCAEDTNLFTAGIMFLNLNDTMRRKIRLMKEWFTSPHYKAVKETKTREKRSKGDITFGP